MAQAALTTPLVGPLSYRDLCAQTVDVASTIRWCQSLKLLRSNLPYSGLRYNLEHLQCHKSYSRECCSNQCTLGWGGGGGGGGVVLIVLSRFAAHPFWSPTLFLLPQHYRHT